MDIRTANNKMFRSPVTPFNPLGFLIGRGKGPALYGTGPGALYGTGRNSGLLPGQHAFPMHEAHLAVHNYKTLHGLHGRGKPNLHLPASHVLHILEHAVHQHETNPKGGFLPMLPLALGAAMPFISGAIGHLLGGFAKRGGEHLANALAGQGGHLAGIPHLYHDHRNEQHVTLHGEGVGDLFKRILHQIRRLISSSPARQFGSQALDALHEAAANAITERLQKVHESAAERLKRLQTMPEEETAPLVDTSAPGMEEQDTPNPDDADHLNPTGMGRRRRRRAPPKPTSMKRARRGGKTTGFIMPPQIR